VDRFKEVGDEYNIRAFPTVGVFYKGNMLKKMEGPSMEAVEKALKLVRTSGPREEELPSEELPSEELPEQQE